MEDLRVLRDGVSSCIVRVVSLRSSFERKNIQPKQDSPFSNSHIKRSAFNPFPSFTSLHSTSHFLLHQPILLIITQMFPTRISYAFLFLAAVVMAEKKKFNVVSFGRKVEVAVNGGSPVWMEKSYPEQPLHSVELDVESPVEYHYIQDGEKEQFSRQFPTGASSTYNDFFGRQDTIKQYSPLPMPFEDKKNGRWTRGMGQVNIYNETYIPTIHITGPNVMEFFKSPEKFKLGKTQREDKYTAFFISQNEIKLLENVSMTSWGERHPKFCIRMTLGGNDEYFGRNVFKFRYGETDPTFMREKLYTDLLVAVGSPVHQTNIVRVYAKGVAIGLYILQDESSDEKFIKTEFYAKGGAPQSMGIPLDADTGADFEWNVQTKSRNKAYDSFMAHASKPGHVNYRSDASNERVVALSHALYMLDPTDEKAVQEFDTKWFDIDIFFKAMAFEYALGHWDSYWGDTSNYALYDDPTESDAPNNYKFYFLDEDFEFTFGSCISKRFTDDGMDFTKQSYKKLVTREWRGSKEHHPRRRAMIDKLFSTEALTKRFEDILVAIIKHLMNPTVMFGRIDAMYERYREEIRWDRTIPRLRSNTEKNNGWTIDDLKFGINGYPQKYGPHGIDWGLKPFIQERADAVAKEFNFEYDNVPQLPRFIPSQLNDKGSLNDRDVEDIQKADVYMSSSAEKFKTSVLTASIIVTSAIMAMTTLIG